MDQQPITLESHEIQQDNPLPVNSLPVLMSVASNNDLRASLTVSKMKSLELTSTINSNISPVNKRKFDSFQNPSESTPSKLAKKEYSATSSLSLSQTISCKGVGNDDSKSSTGLGVSNLHKPSTEENKCISRSLESNLMKEYFETPTTSMWFVSLAHRTETDLVNCSPYGINKKPVFSRNDPQAANFVQNEKSLTARLSKTSELQECLLEIHPGFGSGSHKNMLKPSTITKPTEELITEPLNKSVGLKLSATNVTDFKAATQGGATTVIFQSNYKNKEESQLEFLLKILPDADPTFLEEKSKLEETILKTFISEAFERRDYPKIKTPDTKEENAEDDSSGLGLYTVSFDIEKFLKIFPDPFSYFLQERNCQFSEHGLQFIKRRYTMQSIKVIKEFYSECKFNLARTCEKLDREKEATRCRKRTANEIHMPPDINFPFLQEACFVEHKDEIKAHIDNMAEVRRIAYEEARERGELIECGCCYDGLLFEECAACNDGDLFCKECIRRSAEVRIGDGLTTFPCLSNCGAEFSLQLLQTLLDPRMFSRLLQRVQMAEVTAAGIEGLETCPFCEFASIPPPETSVFVCLNPECLKESCRKCHKISHIPQRCEEVENDDQARARKFIEDEMTKALVRECYKCHKPFIKVSGCNKMKCTCGATMCYICRQPVTSYDHFKDMSAKQRNNDNRCPITSTEKSLHVDAVRNRAERALQEVTEKNPGLTLKHNPTFVLPETPGIARDRRKREGRVNNRGRGNYRNQENGRYGNN